ncbi:MAG: hypothetical protein MUO39_14715 [Steroidobacteraceae bacterium]|nr:hypothetical protein [Steroidobacteraceae bacterium]
MTLRQELEVRTEMLAIRESQIRSRLDASERQIQLTHQHGKGPQSGRRGRRADSTVRSRDTDTPTRRQEETTLQLIPETLRLLRRQAEIRDALRHSSANRVLGERDLFLIRRLLARHPAAVQAITLTASELHRPVESLQTSDVEQRR